MDDQQALSVFAALAQEHRLQIVRMLVQAGPGGMAAGAIADRVTCSRNNASTHLRALTQAGLVVGRREARSIIYSVALARLAELVGFLMQDCCQGHPEVCAPALADVGACSPSKEIA